MESTINETDMSREETGVRNALSTITNLANTLSSAIDSLSTDIKSKNLQNGISLFAVKEKLLVFYMQYLAEFMKMKVSGQKVEGSPVIERLAEIRVYLERIHPIEKKLKYQIEKLLKAATVGATDKNDPSRFRANPATMSLEPEGDDDDGDDDNSEDEGKRRKAGIYVPPKLSAVHYDGDESRVERRKKIMERARKRALQSSVMQELKEEYLDTPVEIKSTNSLKQMEDKYQKRKREFEEEYFTRLPVTKGEIKRAKRISTIGTLGDEVTRFEDTSVLHGKTTSIGKKKKSKTFPKRGGKKKRFKQ